ncbi:MAG: hypothetical protein E7161_03285 [Firmicutes bacterium]|nr:hypothetical protein [Bacillota bacterium]
MQVSYVYKCKYNNINERTREMNNVIITLRTSEEIKKELDKIALDENRSLNNLIVTILMKYLEKNKEVKNNGENINPNN